MFFYSRQSTTNNQDGSLKSSKLKKTPATKLLANEAKDLVRGVKLLIDSQRELIIFFFPKKNFI